MRSNVTDCRLAGGAMTIDQYAAQADRVGLGSRAVRSAIDDEGEHRAERDIVRELGNERKRRDRRKPPSNHSDIDHANRESGPGAPDH
jgi:hypothetical protein